MRFIYYKNNVLPVNDFDNDYYQVLKRPYGIVRKYRVKFVTNDSNRFHYVNNIKRLKMWIRWWSI